MIASTFEIMIELEVNIMNTIYDYSITRQDGTEESLVNYKNKVLLIVNTATRCGFTGQYEGLESLYQEFKGQDFEILDFPSNQFMNQAPEDDEGINEFCSLNYNTSFSRYKKIDVNGDDATPLYRYLRKQKPKDEGTHAKDFALKLANFKHRKEKDAINWNFTKFLIDRNGNVVRRFSPSVEPSELRDVIRDMLKDPQ